MGQVKTLVLSNREPHARDEALTALFVPWGRLAVFGFVLLFAILCSFVVEAPALASFVLAVAIGHPP
jgi:hypothetical protein